MSRIGRGTAAALAVSSCALLVPAIPQATAASPPLPAEVPALDSRLAEVAAVAGSRGEAAAVRAARRRGLRAADGRIEIVVESRGAPGSSVAALRAAGAEGIRTFAGLLEASVPVTELVALARRTGRRIRPPARPVPQAYMGEGVTATNAAAWVNHGSQGQGTKVAIVDVGFRDYRARQMSGDLPATVATHNLCGAEFDWWNAHGTATAEVVHEMAPRAEIHLVCIDSEVGLGLATEYAKEHGIDVIAHSLAWFNTSRGDGTGGPATPEGMVADAAASGILWVTPSGNQAHRHWGGTFTDADRDGRHEWASSDEGNILPLPSGATGCIHLKWDAWPATTRDFDLHIVHTHSGEVIASSENAQRLAAQAPVESACIPPQTYQSPLEIRVIDRNPQAGTRPRLDVHLVAREGALHGYPLEHVNAAGSLVEPAGAPAAVVAGSHCVWDGAPQPYTSLGPTPDGRPKPDLRAPDAVLGATSPYDIEGGCRGAGFGGTSAAAAHAAGAAAAVAGAEPGLSPAGLRAFLLDRLVSGRLWLRAFADVDPGAANALHAEAAWHRGAFSGEGGGPLRPADPVLRGAAARHVLETMRHGGHLPAYRGLFTDMPPGDQRTPWVEHLAEHGAVDPGGAYRPGDPLTRAEAAELILRALGHGGHLPAHQGHFADVTATTPRSAWIEHAYEHGFVARGEDRLFRPGDPLVRGELVEWLTKAWRLRWFDNVPAGLVNDVVAVGDTIWMTHEGVDAVLPYSLLTGELGEPVPVGVNPRELDATPDGTRLVVTNPGSNDLSIVSIADRRETHRIPLASNDSGDRPYSVAVGAHGRALFTTTTFGLFGYTSRIMELDLASLDVRPRPDIASEVTEATYVVPSGDRRRIFVVVGSVTHGPVYAYDSGTDSRLAATAIGDLAGYGASDRRGSTVAVGPNSTILNGNLSRRRDLAGSSFGVGVSPGGGTFYANTTAGMEFVDLGSYERREPIRPLADTIDDALGNFRWLYSPVGRTEVAPDGTFLATVTDGGFSLIPTGADGPDPYTGDATPPDTTIDSGPSGTTPERDATFAFSATEPGAALQTSLDGEPWVTSTSPRTVRDLADGPHGFRVRAIDAAGNLDPTPAERTWTVGEAPPSVEEPPPGTGDGDSADPSQPDGGGGEAGGGGSAFSPGLVVPQIVPDPPVNLSRPRVSGRLRVGSVLRADPGDWRGGEATVAWHRCDAGGRRCKPTGEEGPAYRLRAADAGRRLQVLARATNPGGSASARSTPTGVVQAERGTTLILGSSRDDVLTGTPGPDLIRGGGGRDRIRGGGGRDRLLGGSGSDHLDARDRAADRVDGGPGLDRARLDARDRAVAVERVLRARRASAGRARARAAAARCGSRVATPERRASIALRGCRR